MASFTVDIVPGPNGPLIIVAGSATGHTVTVTDYVHPDAPQGTAVADSQGRRGKRTVVNT